MNNLNNSIYIKDLIEPETFEPLKEHVECDVSIVGGGFTGLSSAIEPVSYTHLTLPTTPYV